jgi:ribose 5-phosphate isomerase A
VHNLDLVDPVEMEKTINNLPGVVTCGLFAMRPADLVLIAADDGIREL